ncbi:thioesterase family protein [uncultured Methylobacterium sp.]|uniref:acyl-CoA thioesterase n=1 Tax=uncultured Methylobacterium sp. TaxID=157278 RepID=UPI00261D1D1D|nr:thioesterase family protein [uncultured Methylobacterium sp.]
MSEPHAPDGDARMLWTDDVLRYRDTDANGHVNNAVFAAFCESGRVQFFRTQFGGGVQPPGTFFVVARFAIDYRAELHYPGRVRTATWIARLGRTSITLRNRILFEDRIAGEAEAVCVLLDKDTRRPVDLGAAAREAAGRFLIETP